MLKRNSMSRVSQAIRATLFARSQNHDLSKKLVPGDYSIKIANTIEEREEAFRLAYHVYLEKGYVLANKAEWLVKPYDANPDTTIFIVQDVQKKIVATVTLVFDEYQPLPADRVYAEELREFRQTREKLVEISRLAIRPDQRNAREILVLLFNYLGIYTLRIKQWNFLIIEVNPRHKEYYHKLLHFTEMGGVRSCPQVQGAPAILLYLSLPQHFEDQKQFDKVVSNRKNRTLFNNFLPREQEELVAEHLRDQDYGMSDYERSYFGLSESGKYQAVLV